MPKFMLIGFSSCPSKPTAPLVARQAKEGGGTSGGVGERGSRASLVHSTAAAPAEREESTGTRVGLCYIIRLFGKTFIFLSEGRL